MSLKNGLLCVAGLKKERLRVSPDEPRERILCRTPRGYTFAASAGKMNIGLKFEM